MKEQNLRVLPRVLVKSKLFCFISSLEETKSIDKSENLYDNVFTLPKLSVSFGVGIVMCCELFITVNGRCRLWFYVPLRRLKS